MALDIETTGLVPGQDKIIEIGAVRIRDGQVTEEFTRLINPHMRLPDKIVELTGIQDHMLLGEEEEETVLSEFIRFAGDDILLGHNILFDYSFIKTSAAKKKIPFEKLGIDTLYLSRMLHADFKSRSLEKMCEYYGILNVDAHRALDDARAACTLYFKLYENFGMEKKELFTARPLYFKPPKYQAITGRQKNYLLDLIKYHKINTQLILKETASVDELTKSQASRLIDNIISEHGRIL